MQVCQISSNHTVADGLQYHHFNDSFNSLQKCGEPTYLRPDLGGSQLPWPYTIIWLIIHFPTTIIRVQRWEKVQVLSLVLAAVSVLLSIQAYCSTKRVPEEVLVWMPLTLVLDAGATMQLFFLIIEETGFLPLVNAIQRFSLKTFRSIGVCWPRAKQRTRDAPDIELQDADLRTRKKECAHSTQIVSGRFETRTSPQQDPSTNKNLAAKAWVALLAFLLFISLLVLQIIGLAAAAQGRHVEDLRAVWCSPIFQPFALAVLTGNCQFYDVELSASKGIGCVRLPAEHQYDWLLATVAIVSISLIFEAFDMAILTLVKSHTRWRGAKMQRPWFTMFSGILVLVIIAAFGIFSASRLPERMTETVWIFRYEASLRDATVCQGSLKSAGVRGSIIGWTDGLLNNWKSVYYGYA